jgi:hypothetical protein
VKTGFHIGFSQAENVDAVGNQSRMSFLFQIWHHLIGKHRLHLSGRTGQKHRGSVLPFILQNQPRRGAVLVLQGNRPYRQVSLLPVIFCHLPVRVEKTPENTVVGFLVKLHFPAEQLGHRFLGQIVVGRAQPSGEHHQIALGEGPLQLLSKPLGVVPHYGLVIYVNADGGQLFGDVSSVGVYNVPQ